LPAAYASAYWATIAASYEIFWMPSENSREASTRSSVESRASDASSPFHCDAW
jgi:hypothetical protein